jgi:hypothetical protein
VEGPERSGSGKGVPVPRRTIWVLGIALFCACEMPYQVKRNKNVNPTAPRFRRFAIIAYPPFETAPRLACWLRHHCCIKLYKKCVFRRAPPSKRAAWLSNSPHVEVAALGISVRGHHAITLDYEAFEEDASPVGGCPEKSAVRLCGRRLCDWLQPEVLASFSGGCASA